MTFDAGPGACVAVAGANGSGKTTLLRILAGLVAPDAGSVSLGGSPPRSAGWAPAGDRAVHWRLTARENLRFVARLAGRVRTERALDEAIDVLRIDAFADRALGRCSTGQRRRVILAQAFVAADALVVLDEPFEDLDAEGIGNVRDAIAGWCEAGGIVVAAAPDLVQLPSATVTVELGRSS